MEGGGTSQQDPVRRSRAICDRLVRSDPERNHASKDGVRLLLTPVWLTNLRIRLVSSHNSQLWRTRMELAS